MNAFTLAGRNYFQNSAGECCEYDPTTGVTTMVGEGVPMLPLIEQAVAEQREKDARIAKSFATHDRPADCCCVECEYPNKIAAAIRSAK